MKNLILIFGLIVACIVGAQAQEVFSLGSQTRYTNTVSLSASVPSETVVLDLTSYISPVRYDELFSYTCDSTLDTVRIQTYYKVFEDDTWTAVNDTVIKNTTSATIRWYDRSNIYARYWRHDIYVGDANSFTLEIPLVVKFWPTVVR